MNLSQTALLPLIYDPVVGKKYHVSWGSSQGVVGVCMLVDKLTKEVVLCSPKTMIVWKNRVKWSDLQYSCIDQARISSPYYK